MRKTLSNYFSWCSDKGNRRETDRHSSPSLRLFAAVPVECTVLAPAPWNIKSDKRALWVWCCKEQRATWREQIRKHRQRHLCLHSFIHICPAFCMLFFVTPLKVLSEIWHMSLFTLPDPRQWKNSSVRGDFLFYKMKTSSLWLCCRSVHCLPHIRYLLFLAWIGALMCINAEHQLLI